LLPPELSRIAFALILVGFGTKVGIVPMHTWLPDAHSRAPSPISGLLSGVLLNAALFAVIRYKSIVDGSLGTSDFTNGLFLVFGALTVLVPAAFIVMQHDYKRLLAYSSIEHMGLILIASGLGALGAVAAIIHMAGHALIKSMLFFGAGNVLLRFKSTKFEHVSGVMKVLPFSGALMLAGIFFLLAAPPSPIFMSEYLIVLAAVAEAPLVAICGLISLVIIAGGFLFAFMPFFFNAPHDGYNPEKGERWNLSHTAMLIHVIIVILIGCGLFLGYGDPFLKNVAEIIG
jgi:hydrogenase-4 component F